MGLSASVGLKSRNLYNDVRKVQQLLCEAREKFPAFKSEQDNIAVDGICGEKTIEAIGVFQSTALNFSYPDKRVDPGGKTWRRLNQNVEDKWQIYVDFSYLKNGYEQLSDWFTQEFPDNITRLASQFRKEMMGLFGMSGASAASSGTGSAKAYRQGDPKWGKQNLGFSKSETIHNAGCALTCLAMAATHLGARKKHWPPGKTPRQLTPKIANSILKKAGAFEAKTYLLYIVGGAEALGMKGADSGIRRKLSTSVLGKLDQCLMNGGLVMAHVNYQGSWVGDHWILITHKNGLKYKAIDPAYGAPVVLGKEPSGGNKRQSHIVLYGQPDGLKDAGKKEKITGYDVVRYVTLYEDNVPAAG